MIFIPRSISQSKEINAPLELLTLDDVSFWTNIFFFGNSWAQLVELEIAGILELHRQQTRMDIHKIMILPKEPADETEDRERFNSTLEGKSTEEKTTM